MKLISRFKNKKQLEGDELRDLKEIRKVGLMLLDAKPKPENF